MKTENCRHLLLIVTILLSSCFSWKCRGIQRTSINCRKFHQPRNREAAAASSRSALGLHGDLWIRPHGYLNFYIPRRCITPNYNYVRVARARYTICISLCRSMCACAWCALYPALPISPSLVLSFRHYQYTNIGILDLLLNFQWFRHQFRSLNLVG